MEWKSIGSAPKDGSEVLVAFDNNGTVIAHIAWYVSEDAWRDSLQYFRAVHEKEYWIGWHSYTHNSLGNSRLRDESEPKWWTEYTPPPE